MAFVDGCEPGERKGFEVEVVIVSWKHGLVIVPIPSYTSHRDGDRQWTAWVS
jgi:hypothetical protein